MIIKDRKSRDEAYEESSWRRFENKMRVWLYTLMDELTRSQHFSVLLYKLVLFIEACQFVWYAWHPRLNFLWDSNIFEGIKTVLKFCQIDRFLQNEGQTVALIILYVTFALLVIMLGIGGVGMVFISKVNYQADSTALNYSLKALNIYNFLLSTILAFPFYFICMTIFGCCNQNPLNRGLDCYEGIYFLHLIVAILSFIILISTSLILTFLSVDLNPWSKSPFAAPKSRVNLLKMFLKIAVCLYYVLDFKGEYVKQFIVVYCILWILILVIRYIQAPLYKRSIFNYILGLEGCILWITLGSVFEALVDSPPADNISLLFIVILIMPWARTVIIVFNMRRDALLKVDHKGLERQIDSELYILNAVELIEHRDDLEKRMTLEGLLKLHIKCCKKSSEECPCRLIAQNYFKEEASEKMWYTWLQSILDDLVKRFPNNAGMHILYACMAREKLENKYKSLFELMAAQKSDPSIEEQFTMYRYRNIIQQDMIDVDVRVNRNKINVNLIVEFQSKFLKFQTAIEASVGLQLDFWRELMEPTPKVQKLQSLGTKITQSVMETASQYKKLALLNSNQIRMLQIYGNFLKDIVNDDIEGGRVINRATHVTKSNKLDKELLDKIQLKYGENSDTCLITCSGNTYNRGTILRANNEITRILKCTKNDVEGANVKCMMPKVIGDMHDDFMKNYLATSVAKTVDKETIAFPINKNGYLVPCTLMVKVLPNLHAGIRFVGFMQEVDEGNELNDELVSARNTQSGLKRRGPESDQDKNTRQKYYIMYDGRSGRIYGVTASCRRDFGISAKLANSNKMGREDFTIDNILPDLLHSNLESLKRPEGVDLTIDTSELKEKFMFRNDDSDDELIDTEVKYQNKQVNVVLIQDDEYPTAHLRVIRFMDTKEADDKGEDSDAENDISALKKSAQKARPEDSPRKTTRKLTMTLQEEEEKSPIGGLSAVEGVASDLSSSQPEMNEEIRLARDFRALISQSSTPRSIIFIRNIAILMALILIALMSFGLSVKFSQISEYREGITAITDSHQRLTYIADLNFNLRRLQLVAGGLITMTTDEVSALRATVLSSLGNLRANNVQIDNHQENLASKGVRSIGSETIVMESLLQNGPRTDTGSFSNTLSQYISHATAAANADLPAFFSTDTRISTKASFFFVRRNGLGPLRQKATDNADIFFDYYWNSMSSFDNKLKIVLIIVIIVVFIALLPIMFIIFSVHKTATSILSLFMFIQPQEVKELARKCQAFIETFLEDRKKTVDFSFAEEDKYHKKVSKLGEQSYIQVNPIEDENRLKNPDASDNRILGEGGMSASTNRLLTTENRPLRLRSKRLGSYIAGERMDTEDVFLRTEGNETTERPLALRENTVKELEEMKNRLGDAKKSAHEEQAEIDVNRAAAFMTSRDEYKGKIILHFILIMLAFLAYFLADYLDNKSSMDQIKTGLVHLKLRNQRMAGLKFVNAFTQEELAEGSEYPVYNYTYQPYTNLRNMYRASTLEIMQALAKNRRKDFSSEFNSYLKMYDIATNGDICASYYNTDSTMLDNCNNAGGGLLVEGTTIAITRVEQISQDIIKEFNQTQRLTADQTRFINSEKFEQSIEILDYLMPAWTTLFDQFIGDFQSYLDQRNTLDRVKFVVFILMMFFMLLFVWIPYKLVLNDKIFRAKGMLKMIPIEMITKDENLKQTFFSGNILQAVK